MSHRPTSGHPRVDTLGYLVNTNPFQKSQDHGGDRLLGKGLDAGPLLQGGDWVQVLPTPKLAVTSLLSPENLVQIGPFVQKLFMIF